MPPKSKKHRDDFEIPNKHRIKVQKRDRKQQLRSVSLSLSKKANQSRNMIESPEDSDDEEYHQKLLNKGSQWWNKVNYRFFRQLDPNQIEQISEKTSGQQLLELKYPAKQLQLYFNQQIISNHPNIANPALLKVLFRKEIKLQRKEINQMVTFAFKQYPQAKQRLEEKLNSNLHLFSFRIPPEVQSSNEKVAQQSQNLDLQVVEVINNEQKVIKMLEYDVATAENEEVERQIILWEQELQKLNSRNAQNWRQMLQRKKWQPEDITLQEQITHIRRQLRMTEVLLYFKRGHSDKTEEMLDQALEVARIREMSGEGDQRSGLTRVEQLKQLFQTDCKICFCTESEDKNKVVYCDGCNTSFHQACYGVEELDNDKFYCQVCQYVQENTTRDRQGLTRTPKKPNCHICNKQNFPMRRLQNRFYHVTCLVLFGFVQIKNYQVKFKNGITHHNILETIVNNEVDSQHCYYCLKETGMKFTCSFEGCGNSYHPICAYLNGVVFDLKRYYRSLEAYLMCPHHFPQRNLISQVYLRRFFCDYNSASKLNQSQFEEKYKVDIEKRKVNLQLKMKERRQGVLRKGKLPKIGRPPSSKSKAPLVEKNEPLGGQECVTETRKLMRMISQNNRSN